MRWPAIVRALAPGHLTFTLAAATALVAVGLPGVPPQIVTGLGSAACLIAILRVIVTFHRRRRLNAALAEIESGRSATAAIRAAHVDADAVWLEHRPAERDYAVVPDPGVRMTAETAAEISRRALRPGERGLRGRLSDGSRIEITPPPHPDVRRLAVVCNRKLSRFELELITVVAERCRQVSRSPGAVDQPEHLQNASARSVDRSSAALIVDLGAFEDVRLAAGQLSAERVTADAGQRLHALLRQSDRLVRLDEDRFGVVLQIHHESQLEIVARRIADTLAEVPVPRRASQIQPTLRHLSRAELNSEPALRRLFERSDPPSSPRRAA